MIMNANNNNEVSTTVGNNSPPDYTDTETIKSLKVFEKK